MKYADKIGAKFVMVLGDSELESNTAKFKEMKTGRQTEVSLGNEILDTFNDIYCSAIFEDDPEILEALEKTLSGDK